jgi:hypothetical protein
MAAEVLVTIMAETARLLAHSADPALNPNQPNIKVQYNNESTQGGGEVV